MRLPFALTACLAALALAAAPALAKPAHKQDHKHRAAATAAVDPALAPVLAAAGRDADRPRDRWRHPAETLAFFRVRPGMTVVDYMPSGGWWTRVLVPYLGEQGRYIGLNPDVRTANEGLQRNFGNLADTFPAKAAGWTGLSANAVQAWNTDGLPPALNGTVDRVMIMREIHNLQRFGMLYRELTAVRRLLKADGLLGIEEHRAKANASAEYADGAKGYMREKDVIALIEAHGFELVGKSEINANPADTADYPDGVWTLPPSYRLGEKDRARYAAIGESDRMTLIFRKRP